MSDDVKTKWLIKYYLPEKETVKELRELEVYAKNPFEAYHNGMNMIPIIEKDRNYIIRHVIPIEPDKNFLNKKCNTAKNKL